MHHDNQAHHDNPAHYVTSHNDHYIIRHNATPILLHHQVGALVMHLLYSGHNDTALGLSPLHSSMLFLLPLALLI